MIEKKQLISDLKALGINKGDVLFVRISYKSIGKVDGGPNTVIDSLLEVIGEEGTLVAAAFPDLQKSRFRFLKKKRIYEPGMKPNTGVIPVLMAERSNVFFSSHPTTPYVAIGKLAKTLTDNHTPYVDAYHIVRDLVKLDNSKCIRIGGDVLDGTTHIAFTDGLVNINAFQRRIPEGMYYHNEKGIILWHERTHSAFCHNGFNKFFAEYIYPNKEAVLSEGFVGSGKAMVTSMKKTYEIENTHISKNPQILLCDDPNCVTCRASFSFSKPNKTIFLFKQIPQLFGDNRRRALHNIRETLIVFTGRKCR